MSEKTLTQLTDIYKQISRFVYEEAKNGPIIRGWRVSALQNLRLIAAEAQRRLPFPFTLTS